MSSLIWITGLSGSGKTTLAKSVYDKIVLVEKNTVLLDGDTFREVLSDDFGHSLNDRLKVAKKISKMCEFLINQNINVVCATMSLFKEIHEQNRKNIETYIEVYVECDMKELIRRDQKSLYSKALNKEINDVVGVDLPYDKPVNCDIVIDNSSKDKLDEKVQVILDSFNKKNIK